MAWWRWRRNDGLTEGAARREPGGHGAGRRGGWQHVVFLAAVAALAVLACSDDRRDPSHEDPATITDRLRANADAFAYGIGQPGSSLTLAIVAGAFHNSDVRRYPYDVAAANRLLDEAGWSDTDGDGFREDEAGNTLAFTLLTNAGNSVREQIGTIIQQGFTDIGIGTDYQVIDFGDLVARLTATHDWDAVIIGFTGDPDPHGGIAFWHSSEALHLWHPNQAQPATAWEAEIDDL